MATQCKECGTRLAFFEKMRGECNDCTQRRLEAEYAAAAVADAKRWEELKKKWSWRVFNRVTVTTSLGQVVSPPERTAVEVAEQEYGNGNWIEVMLMLAWIMCFAGAAVFGYMALVAANDRYGQEGAAILSTVYALTLCVSGVVFAAICKIVSSLSSINDNLSLLVKQTPKSDTKGLKETDSGSR